MSSASNEICDEWDWSVWGLVCGMRLSVALVLGLYALFLVNLEPGLMPCSGMNCKAIAVGICLSLFVAYQIVTIIPLDNEGIVSKVFSLITIKTGTALPFLLQAFL